MDNFKDRVKQSTPIEGLSSYVMKTGAKDIITLSGSFLGGALYSQSHKEQAATITASMLDKGTEKKDKYEIGDQLESVGAEIHFMSKRHHTQFSAHCLKDNLNTVIALLVEQLRTPSFPEKELSTLCLLYTSDAADE